MRITTSSKPCIGLIIFISFLLLTSFEAAAQNEVAIGSGTTKSNAILWLNGNGSQGLILPVVTNKSTVSNPDKGMVVYDDSDNKVWYRSNSAWVEVGSGTGASTANLNLLLQGNQLQLRDGTTVQSTVNIAGGTQSNGAFLVFTGGSWQYATLSGDVTGANAALQVNGIKGKTITTLPATAQALVYDPTANGGAGGWVFQALTTGTTVPTLNNGQLLTGNGTTNSATTITGDATLSGGALTIGNSAITTAKINAAAVDNTKLADNAVTSVKITDATITGADIAATTITSSNLANATIAGSKIASATITGSNIAATTITADKLAPDAVTSVKIVNGAVTGAKIQDDSISTAKIVSGSVTSDKIQDLTVQAGDIADDAIIEAKILDGAVTSSKLGANAVTVTAIAANAVTRAKLASSCISSTELDSDAVQGIHIKNNVVSSEKIQDGAVIFAKIGSKAIDGTKLADDISITSAYHVAPCYFTACTASAVFARRLLCCTGDAVLDWDRSRPVCR